MAVLVRRRRRGSPQQHAEANNTDVGANAAAALAPRYVLVADDAAIVSQAITITKKCCVVVVTTTTCWNNFQSSEIRRLAIDRTLETTISSTNFAFTGPRGHLQYATEVLDPGTYTYALTNSSGGNLEFYGATIKIVAVSI